MNAAEEPAAETAKSQEKRVSPRPNGVILFIVLCPRIAEERGEGISCSFQTKRCEKRIMEFEAGYANSISAVCLARLNPGGDVHSVTG